MENFAHRRTFAGVFPLAEETCSSVVGADGHLHLGMSCRSKLHREAGFHNALLVNQITAVIASVVGVFFFREVVRNYSWGIIVSAILNAIQIAILNYVCIFFELPKMRIVHCWSHYSRCIPWFPESSTPSRIIGQTPSIPMRSFPRLSCSSKSFELPSLVAYRIA